jgi:hypothetical protein
MHFLTLFSICFAAIDEDIVQDAGSTVDFLDQQTQDFLEKPYASRLLYLIVEALRRYHPLAALAAWNQAEPVIVTRLRGLYTLHKQVPYSILGLSYIPDQMDEERTAANAILEWASPSNDARSSAIHDGGYHPGLKMFIILHTIAVVCRIGPTKQRARALAARWLANLDLPQLIMCELIMIDVYRWANQAWWDSYPIIAPQFFRALGIDTLWDVPQGYDRNRWMRWMKLFVTSPWDRWVALDMSQLAYPAAQNSTGPSTNTDPKQAVFDLFRLYLTESISYIRDIVATGSGTDNASHMIQSMETMWGKVNRMLADDDPIKINVQNQLNRIRAELQAKLDESREQLPEELNETRAQPPAELNEIRAQPPEDGNTTTGRRRKFSSISHDHGDGHGFSR